MLDKNKVVLPPIMLRKAFSDVSTNATTKGSCTQPTSVQQLKAEIALLADKMESDGLSYGMYIPAYIHRLRQLSAV